MNMKKTALAVALAGTLGVGIGTAQASLVQSYQPYSYTGSNFTMLTPSSGINGGTNDVSGSWTGTVYNSQSDVAAIGTNAVGNMTLSSPTKFSGYLWDAHNIQVFGPGSYTFTADADTSTSTWDTGGATQTMVVGPGQVGAHMLFDWGVNHNIDVVDVMNINSNYTSGFYTGGGTTSDSWSGNNNHIWGLASTGGQGMPNGPFAGFKANFSVYNGANVANVAPVPIPAAAWLFGSGLIGLVGVSRRRRQNRQS